jgi:hypothetical protein
VHVRYRAWLDAWPGPKAKSSRGAAFRREEESGEIRPQLDLPPIPEVVEHLVGYLFEVGPNVGEHSVPFSEINAWRQETGVVMSEFETRALRVLSQEYMQMRHEASDAKCSAPYMTREGLPSKEAVSNALGALLRSFNTPRAKAAMKKRQAVRAAESKKEEAE